MSNLLSSPLKRDLQERLSNIHTINFFLLLMSYYASINVSSMRNCATSHLFFAHKLVISQSEQKQESRVIPLQTCSSLINPSFGQHEEWAKWNLIHSSDSLLSLLPFSIDRYLPSSEYPALTSDTTLIIMIHVACIIYSSWQEKKSNSKCILKRRKNGY